MKHLTEGQLADYRQRCLEPAELLAADDHLAACPQCREALSGVTASQTARFAARVATRHLEYEELESLVRQSLSAEDRARCNAHIAGCPQCKLEADDLRMFHEAFEKRHAPKLAPQVMKPVWGFGWWWPKLAVGGALAALVAGVMLWNQGPQKQPEKKVELAVSVRDGAGIVGLDPQGKLVTPVPLSDEDRQLLGSALSGKLPAPQGIDNLRGKTSVLLGEAPKATFALVGPMGTTVVEQTPTFRWDPMPGATGYVVSVFDENFQQVAVSPRLQGTTWTVRTPLPRGKTYSWQVTAHLAGNTEVRAPLPPAPEAKFRVLPAEQATPLEQAAQEPGSSHLLLAARYLQAGAIESAGRELEILREKNPDSALVASWTEQLKRLRSESQP